MAIFSVKFQRAVFYLLVLLCVVLLYQIFNHGSNVVRSKKRSVRYNENIIAGLERGGQYNTRRTRDPPTDHRIKTMTSRNIDDNNSPRLRENILRKEIKALKLRLQTSGSTIKNLRESIKEHEADKAQLEDEISQLKAQNVELLAEVESHHYSSSSHTDKIDSEENGEGSATHSHITPTANRKISEAVAFQSFAKTHVFEAEFLPKPKDYIFRGHQKNARGVKSDKRHIVEMEDLALKVMNANTSLQLGRENILEGVYRFDIRYGTDYEIYFRDPERKNGVLSARISRPLSAPQVTLPSMKHKHSDEIINLILPLSGRIERFLQFIDLFIEVCIKTDKNVYLTVVLYGQKDFKTVKRILKDLEDSYNFRKYQLVMRNKAFSRGRALHDGVTYWKGENPNVLMFFCDVDVTFRAEFLRRCRTYTEPGKQVYYPVVFSLYNPKNVYEDGAIPSPQEQLRIDRPYGFWRIYGYGMTCQYRSDYLKAGGFDLSIKGWGSEDLKLHRMYVAQSQIRIIRAPDRDLFHHYHEKHCDPSLKWVQYRSCLGSKAKVEGTKKQIAMKLFKLREKYEADS